MYKNPHGYGSASNSGGRTPRCPHCGKEFDLPRKVVVGGKVKFVCPHCGREL